MPRKHSRAQTKEENEVRKGKFTQTQCFVLHWTQNGWLNKCTKQHPMCSWDPCGEREERVINNNLARSSSRPAFVSLGKERKG
jgi:hypothetical protein